MNHPTGRKLLRRYEYLIIYIAVVVTVLLLMAIFGKA